MNVSVIASELGIANTISRYFDWAANVLFADDIPHLTDASKTTFFLGGKDAIIHAEVRQCLAFVLLGSSLTKRGTRCDSVSEAT